MPEINKINLMSEIDQISYNNLMEMQKTKTDLWCSSKGYVQLHKEIHGERVLYAGLLRESRSWKGGYFTSPDCIDIELDSVMANMYAWHKRQEKCKHLNLDTLCMLYARLNNIHPFHDGNGRTQREFLRRLLLKHGYVIDFHNTTYSEMAVASNKARCGDYTALLHIFKRIITENDCASKFYENLDHLAILSADDIELAARHKMANMVSKTTKIHI